MRRLFLLVWAFSVDALLPEPAFAQSDRDIDYFYTSRLSGEPAAGVEDFHLHPSEPREFRLSLTAHF